jgi:hypothetical protein
MSWDKLVWVVHISIISLRLRPLRGLQKRSVIDVRTTLSIENRRGFGATRLQKCSLIAT